MNTTRGITRREFVKLPSAAAIVSATSRFSLALPGQMSPTGQFSVPLPNSPDVGPAAFERVTLEMSLKPFHSVDEATIRAVCTEVFRSWAALIRRVDRVAIMLWTADGSEILEYKGRMSDEIEWARYIGVGSRPKDPPNNDPDRIGLHSKSVLYMKDPPKITYATLGLIVRTLKSVGSQMTGKPVEVGNTFDPGPEFANSRFKYVLHPEIAKGNTHGRDSWVSCISKLHADPTAYAGFPGGIPEGTSIGTYLGRQSQQFLTDLGFDYLWLSNGFGFTINSWDVRGPLFDGTHFDTADAEGLREEILSFWKDYRKWCPTIRLETRGTNLLLGSDLSTSASPLRDIYRGNFGMIAPPNSPWAALDGDFGLELVGYLSRIAELPANDKFPFRFYTHDPWWLNSPWFDRYDRQPHDIYMPLALARINGKASVTRPSYLEFLTINNSYGHMPEQCPNEVIPFVLAAADTYSDAPGLITWICPFDEYHEMVFGPKPQPEIPFFADWFLRGAVNSGLPVNTVVSTRNLISSLSVNPGYFDETILLTLVPAAGSPVEALLLDRVRRGLPVILFGPITHAGAALLEQLNLQIDEPVSGEVTLTTSLTLDELQHGGDRPMTFHHRSTLCGGGIDTVAAKSTSGRAQACAHVRGDGKERVYAVVAGSLAWIRGTFTSELPPLGGGHIPIQDDPSTFYPAEALVRALVARFGYSVQHILPTAATRVPLVFAASFRNAFFVSGFCPSTTAAIRLRFPEGAPILTGAETWLSNGSSTYTMPRAWRHELRCFVNQAEEGEISCVPYFSGQITVRRRLLLKGLKNATVTFIPEDEGRVVMAVNDYRDYNETSIPLERLSNGKRLRATGVTGALMISW